MNDILKEYKQNGLIGLYHLLNYLKNKKDGSIKFIKLNGKYIKFWSLITLLQNNHELIFDEIDDDTLHDLFNLIPIRRSVSNLKFDSGKEYDYGIGIKTKSILPYRLQFKIIRNSIAHNQFTIDEDGLIYIKNDKYNYEVLFDYKWFEAAIVCSLSNRNYQFKSGLYDSFLISLNSDGEVSKERLFDSLKNKTSGIIKVTLITNSLERACRSLQIKYVENLKFYTLFSYIKEVFQKELIKNTPDKDLSSADFNMVVNKALKSLNNVLKDSFKIEYIPFTLDFAGKVASDDRYEKVDSYATLLEILFSYYKSAFFSETENILAYKWISDSIDFIEKGEDIPLDYALKLENASNFIIKSLGNLIFNVLLYNTTGYKTLSNKMYQKYLSYFKIDYGHAKSYYKEEIKKLTNMVNEAETYGFPSDKYYELSKAKEAIIILNNKLELLEKGENPGTFFVELRNIFAHGYSRVDNDTLYLYDKDITRVYYKYSKSKKSWEKKEFDSPVIFNLEMPAGVFMAMSLDIIRELRDELTKKDDKRLK